MPAGRPEPGIFLHDVLGVDKLVHIAEDQSPLGDTQHVHDPAHSVRDERLVVGVELTPDGGLVIDEPVQDVGRRVPLDRTPEEIADLHGIDLSLSWSLAQPRGMERPQGARWSGHANDVVRTGSALLVASEKGGVWLLPDDGAAVNVSHGWGQPDVNCLLQGPSGAHILSAGRGLYVNSGTTSLRFWDSVPMPDGVEEVYQAVYVAERNTVVLADKVGVHYAKWPASAGDPWQWTRVPILQEGPFSGLALGPAGTVVAGYWGANLASAFYGIVRLRFNGDALEIEQRAAILGNIDESKMRRVSLTSSAADRNRMYATASKAVDKDSDHLLAVLRSDDGGLQWRPSGTALSTPSVLQKYGTDLLEATGHQGEYNNCIEVSPTDPDIVLLGWCTSGPFVSTDAAKTWRLKHADQDSYDLHSDLHAVRFDQTDQRGQRFYVCSDGGVVVTADLGDTFDSSINAFLPDLQLQSMPARAFRGSFHASPVAPGIVAGGLQDDGVACGEIASEDPWQLVVAGGDGFRCVFLQTGQLILTWNSSPAPQYCDRTGTRFGDPRHIPLKDAKPGAQGNPSGIFDPIPDSKDHWYRNTYLAPVTKPSRHDEFGALMQAVGSVYGDVYGLFVREDGVLPHWSYIGSVPIDVSAYEITSLSSYHGDNVYVGTSDGRIFALDSVTGGVLELNVTTRKDSSVPISHIASADSSEPAYAIHGTNLLRQSTFAWDKVAGLPNETLFSVIVDPDSGGQTVFVSTDSRVYSSRDAGSTWLVASLGLPERPHCGDLAIGPSFSGSKAMYLATYGRSVWWTPLP